jgi:hypothetical protein
MSPPWTLADCWAIGDIAVGHATGVLIQAVINGLMVFSTDPRHVVNDCADRAGWLRRLSWAQWHHTDIQNGKFWEYLRESIDITNYGSHSAHG